MCVTTMKNTHRSCTQRGVASVELRAVRSGMATLGTLERGLTILDLLVEIESDPVRRAGKIEGDTSIDEAVEAGHVRRGGKIEDGRTGAESADEAAQAAVLSAIEQNQLHRVGSGNYGQNLRMDNALVGRNPLPAGAG